MPTAIGANTVTAIARHYIMPTITDNVYSSNVLLWRLLRANKKMVQGGTQIEVPLLYARFNSGGTYRGYQVLNTTPSDTIRNAVFDWKQHYVTWALDGLTLIKTDSPDAIANHMNLLAQQAYMEMAENLAAGLYGNGTTDPNDIDGFAGAVGNAAVGNATYGGISRSANSWWNSTIDAATATLTFNAMQSQFGLQTVGGQHPTLIVSRQEQYNRGWALNAAGGYSVQNVRQPSGHDELMASAGFTNMVFNNVPWVVDAKCGDGPSASNSRIYTFNENVLGLVVSPRADFYLEDFQRPVNQDAFVSTLLWAGNLVCMNAKLQGVFTAITA